MRKVSLIGNSLADLFWSEVTSIVYGNPNGRRRSRAENNIESPYEGWRWCDATERELIANRTNCTFRPL